jgi:hypothetical protein
MPEEKQPDYAPKTYDMPKMDFSGANLEKVPTKTKTYTVVAATTSPRSQSRSWVTPTAGARSTT